MIGLKKSSKIKILVFCLMLGFLLVAVNSSQTLGVRPPPGGGPRVTVINHSPSSPHSSDSVTITATIDSGGQSFTSVTVYYSSSYIGYKNKAMSYYTHLEGNIYIYKANIGTFLYKENPSHTVTYYVKATTSAGSHTSSSKAFTVTYTVSYVTRYATLGGSIQSNGYLYPNEIMAGYYSYGGFSYYIRGFFRFSTHGISSYLKYVNITIKLQDTTGIYPATVKINFWTAYDIGYTLDSGDYDNLATCWGQESFGSNDEGSSWQIGIPFEYCENNDGWISFGISYDSHSGEFIDHSYLAKFYDDSSAYPPEVRLTVYQ